MNTTMRLQAEWVSLQSDVQKINNRPRKSALYDSNLRQRQHTSTDLAQSHSRNRYCQHHKTASKNIIDEHHP